MKNNSDDSMSLFGSTKIYKALAVGVSLLTIASAAFAGCIKDIDNTSQLTGNERAVKLAEGNVSGGGHIEFYYRCPGMDGIKGDVCMIYDGEWRCGEPTLYDIGISDSKKLQDDICFNGEPKEAILKKISQNF